MQKIILLSLMLASGLTLCPKNWNASSSTQTSISTPQGAALGKFSISLAVKDIEASAAFYKKIGFKAIDNIDYAAGKWLILKKEETKIGLFQDLFPKNTLTFNPTDARSLYKNLEQENLKAIYSQDLDQAKGPCSFVLSDPDGNPILFDQHN